MLTLQVPAPEQSPDHPVKEEPQPGVAVRVTLAPLSNACEQVELQSSPAGLEVTVPEPDPDVDTLNVSATPVKFAITAFAWFIVRTQSPFAAEQAPDQPEKTEPAAGVAVSVTSVPAS